MSFHDKFKFDIKHVKGKERKIVNTLRMNTYNFMELTVSKTNIDFIEQIQKSITSDPKYMGI